MLRQTTAGSMASRRTHSLSSMNKAEIIEALKELGETPPQKWSKVELKSRLMELEEDLEIKRTASTTETTTLQKWVAKLNMVNKRRSTLREFITEELKGNAPDSCTKDQLGKIAMDCIYDKAEACGSDPVNFGAHAAKSYLELKESEGGYCQWVKATAPESNSARLVQEPGLSQSQGATSHSAPFGGESRQQPRDTGHDEGAGGGSPESAERPGQHQGGAAQEEDPRWRGEQWELLPSHRDQGRQDLVAGSGGERVHPGGAPPEVRPLSRARAQALEKAASEIGSHAFEALTSRGPTWLIEVACSPESLLSSEVQRLAGYEGAAIRCAHWNGCDLETRSGVKQVIWLIITTISRNMFGSAPNVALFLRCSPSTSAQSNSVRTWR